MAIRIRHIGDVVVAVCAAKTTPKPGDIYLDDSAHHALTTKFGVDWVSEGRFVDDCADEVVKARMLAEEGGQTLPAVCCLTIR